ncbi:MAG: GDSL-type esterase/lipase family protein [Gammaproteobacteria bacterium]
MRILILLCCILLAPAGVAAEKAAPVVLAFGDSLTFGKGVTPNEAYPKDLARISGWHVVNGGISGETTAEGRQRLPGLLAKVKPDYLVLIEGGNDSLHMVPVEETQRNLVAMIRMAQRAGVRVVMFGLPAAGLDQSKFWFDLAAAPQYINAARATGVAIDVQTLPVLLLTPWMKSDPLHLNARGYRELAKAAWQLLGNSKQSGQLIHTGDQPPLGPVVSRESGNAI